MIHQRFFLEINVTHFARKNETFLVVFKHCVSTSIFGKPIHCTHTSNRIHKLAADNCPNTAKQAALFRTSFSVLTHSSIDARFAQDPLKHQQQLNFSVKLFDIENLKSAENPENDGQHHSCHQTFSNTDRVRKITKMPKSESPTRNL